MSKPKKGYKRKSVDIKESTLKKITKKAVDKSKTAKELLEEHIEANVNNI